MASDDLGLSGGYPSGVDQHAGRWDYRAVMIRRLTTNFGLVETEERSDMSCYPEM